MTSEILVHRLFPCAFSTLKKNLSSNDFFLLSKTKNPMNFNRPFAASFDETFKGKTDSFAEIFGNEIVIVFGLILLIIFLLAIMAIMNCWLKCSDDEKNGRRLSIKSTDFKYVQQIQKLLEKQQEFEEKRNFGQKIFIKNEVNDNEFLPQPSPRPSSRASSPGRSRSRTSTNPQTLEKLARLKFELEQYKIDHSIQIRPPVDDATLGTRRRTWGGLQDEEFSEEEALYDDVEGVAVSERAKSPKFIPIQLPPNVSDAAVQTTGTLERKFPENKRIFMTSFETTV